MRERARFQKRTRGEDVGFPALGVEVLKAEYNEASGMLDAGCEFECESAFRGGPAVTMLLEQ